jgi:DNA-binding CsgD family transcriptional regulator
VVGHREAAQRRPVRRQRGSIAWEPIPAWRPAGLADLQTSFADPCARSTAAAGAAGHLPGLHQLGLTPRDREALALVANGRSNRQITEALFFSLKTAGVHVSNILAKLGVAGRVDRPPPWPRLLVAEATPAPGPRLPLPTTSHQAMTSPICDWNTETALLSSASPEGLQAC